MRGPGGFRTAERRRSLPQPGCGVYVLLPWLVLGVVIWLVRHYPAAPQLLTAQLRGLH